MNFKLTATLLRFTVASTIFILVSACSKKQDDSAVMHLNTGSYDADLSGANCSSKSDDYDDENGSLRDIGDASDNGGFDKDDFESDKGNNESNTADNKKDSEDREGSYGGDENKSDDGSEYENSEYEEAYVGYALSTSNQCNSQKESKKVWYCEGNGGIFNPKSGPYNTKAQCESKCGYAMKCYARSAN